MEERAQASDCDSDETVIEGSVTENEMEDELPWRRLILSQDTSFRSEFCLHSGVNGMWKGMLSPEIQHGLKLRKDSEEQKNKNEMRPTLSDDLVLQELRENADSPEISLLSDTSLMASDLVGPKEKSLLELLKTLAVPNTCSEPGKEVTPTMTSKETKDEESSLETFVSTLERLLEPTECAQQERLLEIMNDLDPQEFMNSLNSSLSPVFVPWNALSACYRDVLENVKDNDALPAEVLAAISTLPDADVGPICQGPEQSSSVSGGHGWLQVRPAMSPIDEDCTQIPQTVGDPESSLQTLTHKNTTTSYEQLNNKGNSDPMKNTSVQETPHVLRRSSRLEKLKASRDVLKTPERSLSKPLSCEDRGDSISAAENFSERKNVHSSRFKNEQIRKNEQLRIKNGKRNKKYLCCINQRNAFGENSVYRAAVHNDTDLVRQYIERGGNVNQPSYAGWTALHEACVGGYYQTVSELLKGGADVNVKGKYQITPLHDAVVNGHYKVAELLLLNGADPLFKSEHGTCALDEAKDSFMENLLRNYVSKQKECQISAQKTSTDPACVEDTFQYKVTEANTAGIDKQNGKGESRLHVAARRGNLSLVKVLIESGADVNLKDNAGWTPLHEASSEGFNDVIVELLKAGANVNCENTDGILPLHGAAAGNHLKAAATLLEHGANPNQKDQKQRTALEEAEDENMKELLKSYGAVESSHGVTISAIRPKRYEQCVCDDDKPIGPPSSSHKAKGSESLLAHQTVSAILQDIEEKQENLLKFEIKNSADAEQYIGKMLEIKEVMDNILAQQKTERDDLAKKYRVSMESFKHGALREQLTNLATRQKSLLVVAQKQKKIRMKLQNYKNAIPFSAISLRKLPCSSDISSEKKSQEPPSPEDSARPPSGSPSPASLTYRSMQEMPLSLEIQGNSQDTNTCLDAEVMRREFSGNEMNSKRNVQDCALDGLLKSRHSDGTVKIKSSSQPVAFFSQAENSQAENVLMETTIKGRGFDSSPAVTGTINISEDKSISSQNDAYPAAVPQNQDLSHCNPKRRNKKTASQRTSGGVSEPLTHQVVAVVDPGTEHQTKPSSKNTASAVSHADGMQISPSAPAHQHSIKKPPYHRTAPRKKTVQLKDLILLGRINPGKDMLEFKTQETTHKASILLNGKLKVENGHTYQNPVTWLKDLLGGSSYVTWNYAWSKVTYLGKELLKYVSEEAPAPPEPHNPPQQPQPCRPDIFRKPMQSIPHYLQIKEILLISNQELLPCHVMEQHWKFYMECKKLMF